MCSIISYPGLKTGLCDAYTPAGEPIPTNKRFNAEKIFSHPDVVAEEPWFGCKINVVGTEDSIEEFPNLTFILLAFPTLKNMNHLSTTTEYLLELAANNDVDGFRKLSDQNPSIVDDVIKWYERRKGSKQMVLENMTHLMVAATYGSVDVVKMILYLTEIVVNQSCGKDKSTLLFTVLHLMDLKVRLR